MPKGKVVSCLQAVLLLPRLSTDHGWWHWPRFLSAFLTQGEDTCEPKTSASGPLFSRYHLYKQTAYKLLPTSHVLKGPQDSF